MRRPPPRLTLLVRADLSADPEPDVHAFLTQRIFPTQAQVITSADLRFVLSDQTAIGS